MEQVIGAVLIFTAGIVTFIALFTAVALLMPGMVGRVQSTIEAGPAKAFLLGLVNLVFFGAIAALGLALAGQLADPFNGILALPCILILLALLGMTGIGVTGLIVLVRERMAGSPSAVRGTLRAALLVLLAGMSPFIGWYIFTPLALITGLGAAILALVQRAPRVAAAPQAE